MYCVHGKIFCVYMSNPIKDLVCILIQICHVLISAVSLTWNSDAMSGSLSFCRLEATRSSDPDWLGKHQTP